MISHAVALVCGDHVVVSVLVLRIPAVAGLALALVGLPRLAGRLGTRVDRALWAALANPLTLVLTLGGGHNDLLVMGFITAATAVAVRPGRHLTGLLLATALMTAAAAVKSPAAVGIAFVVPLWLAGAHARRVVRAGVLRACLVVIGTAAATFTVITLLSGYDLGWLHQVNSRAPVVNWLSLPTAVALLVALAAHGRTGATHLDATMEHIRTGGLVLAGLVGVALWAWSVYPRVRAQAVVVGALITTLAALVVLGPAVQPWYLVWLLPLLAARRPTRWSPGVVIGLSIALLLLIEPKGTVLIMSPAAVLVVLAGGLVAIGWDRWNRRQPGTTSVPGDDDAHRSGAGVRSHRRADL